MTNPGKAFEKDFKVSTDKYSHISIDRFYDTQGGYSVKNVSDYVLYRYPYQYYVELKSHLGDRIPYSVITIKQYSGLLEKAKINGVGAGVLFNYRDHEECYFVDIKYIKTMVNEGQASLHIDDARRIGVQLPILKKRRVTFDYDVDALLTGISWEI